MKTIPSVVSLLVLAIFSARADITADGPRQHLSMDLDWAFIKGDPAGAQNPTFDDTAWRVLDVPHDWSIEGPYDQATAAEFAPWAPPEGDARVPQFLEQLRVAQPGATLRS